MHGVFSGLHVANETALWEVEMHDKLAFICSNRVAAPYGMLVCPDCIGNIAGRANSTSTTGIVYKHVQYLIGTLCNVEAKKRGMSNEILAFQANSHIRLPAILWLLQRNLTIEEGHERVLQKDITPDPKAVIAHAQVVKNSDNMRQIRHKSACT
ncbi:hypothetical protein D6D15_06906 [Aureobasidium pullulans]|uniref:Uncharacterized protein n=1 Tax=Aureobasidium pullulans TaxID=5580 RepID=A0A4S9B3H5_AURPU|nr:hypothetical protein D6D15_06906 [Aureobasidium pullulans]